jgi:hypothetical protein
MATRTYRYRINPVGGKKARTTVTDNPELLRQLHLAHDLRNALVAAEHQHEAAMRQMWLGFPTLAAMHPRTDRGGDDPDGFGFAVVYRG